MPYFKRAIFPKGKQKEFWSFIMPQIGLSVDELAKKLRVHPRSVRDWRREKYSIPLPALRFLCKKSGTPLPDCITIKKPFWYANLAGPAGAAAVIKKYGHIGGNQEYRKKKWFEWWETKGKFAKNGYFETRKIIKPKESEDLAEFIGIVLGDGGITPRQVAITLNKTDDIEYIEYVSKLIRRLFDVSPSVLEQGPVVDVLVSRTELVLFLLEKGLRAGNKVRNQVDVPEWIKDNDAFSKRCVRGLIDTDGSYYSEIHNYKEKIYNNCVINFTNRSFPLLNFVRSKLREFDFRPRKSNRFSVCLGREEELTRYFKEIGTSNPKHFRKYKKFMNDKYGGVPKWS